MAPLPTAAALSIRACLRIVDLKLDRRVIRTTQQAAQAARIAMRPDVARAAYAPRSRPQWEQISLRCADATTLRIGTVRLRQKGGSPPKQAERADRRFRAVARTSAPRGRTATRAATTCLRARWAERGRVGAFPIRVRKSYLPTSARRRSATSRYASSSRTNERSTAAAKPIERWSSSQRGRRRVSFKSAVDGASSESARSDLLATRDAGSAARALYESPDNAAPKTLPNLG